MKKFFILSLILFFCSQLSYAGEWRKNPFKDVRGNNQYTYRDGNYNATIKKKAFQDIRGNDQYTYQDNRGNRRTIRKKAFPDIHGNPVYEDVDD